jgi:SAM-dependent methyltransferase
MDPARARAYYQTSYFRGGDYEDYPRDESIIKRNFDRFAKRMKALGPHGRLLEVGCAYGYFMDIAQWQWDIEGIDISEAAVDAARARHGQRVRCGDLLSTPLENSAYDWVVAWDVIEHVDRPRQYLRRIGELLRPGGHLALTTGDIASLAARVAGRRWRLLTPPSHLTYFTRKGIQSAVRQAGLRTVSIATAGYERSLSFALFRLLGSAASSRLFPEGSSRRRWIERVNFYVDLGDIMFVIAHSPVMGEPQ